MPLIHVPVFNGTLANINTYRMAIDTLNAIILIKDQRIAGEYAAQDILKNKILNLQNWNTDLTTLNTRCDDEVKKQTKLAKFWKNASGVAGVVIVGLAIAVIL